MNFKDWTQISTDYTNYTRSVHTTVTGRLTIEYQDPITNSLIGYTSVHTITEIFPNSF